MASHSMRPVHAADSVDPANSADSADAVDCADAVDAADALERELTCILGRAQVLRGADIPAQHTTDWFGVHHVRPRLLVRPGTPQEVAQVLAVCSHRGQSVTVQGGLTGLVAGALPGPGDIALSMERLRGIEEIDTAASCMVVRAGTHLQQVQEAARDAGLLFAVDLGARGSCQIGGAIATNAGGNRVLRYGMMREQVLGLEVALADGTLVTSLNRMQKNNAGYDLKHWFIGSEGTLGIITRAVLRLHPLPLTRQTAWCALANESMLIPFLHHVRSRLGGTLSAFEVMWPDFMAVVAGGRIESLRAPLAQTGAIQVLVEAEGSHPDGDEAAFASMLEAAFDAGLLGDACIAQSLDQGAGFWRLRDAVGEFPRMWSPYCGYDISLPIGDVTGYVAQLQAALRARFPGCEHVHFGHIGDSNLHVGVHLPPACGAFDEAAIDAVVYGLLRSHGGSVSAEHGIGLHKRPWLADSRSAPEIALMRQIKRALDPGSLLNPGKVFDAVAAADARRDVSPDSR